MSLLDSMLERNKDFAARQAAAGTLMPWLPRALPSAGASQCEGDHNRLR
jgi:carbonic anhydrase